MRMPAARGSGSALLRSLLRHEHCPRHHSLVPPRFVSATDLKPKCASSDVQQVKDNVRRTNPSETLLDVAKAQARLARRLKAVLS
jgi:hypothetical protein